YKRLIEECNLTIEKVAHKIGKDRSTINNILRLLKLPSELQDSLKTNVISMGHARAILAIDDKSDQLNMLRKIRNEDLSVRKVEALIKKITSQQSEPGKASNPVQKNKFHLKVENTLRQNLGTQVNLIPRKKGGSIDIQFYSDEDLERLLELFEGIKQQMKKSKSSKLKNRFFTVILIPEHESSTKSYKIKTITLKIIGILIAIKLLALVILVLFNLDFIEKGLLYDSIVDENKVLKKQASKINEMAVDLQKLKNYRLMALESVKADQEINETETADDSVLVDILNQRDRMSVYLTAAEVFYETVPSLSPVENPIVSRGFELSTDEKSSHIGTDIVAKLGSPVKAAASGIVSFTGWTYNYGHTIIIEHADNYRTVYKHNQRTTVILGQRVKKGDIIAFVGNTGKITTGVHLHFELWSNSNPIDPAVFISELNQKVF
ncbi:MAG: peptidoglycan DD-metalloendopeptidase family protein, partial [Calditrichaeota bacterium]|nr:peptidoglycan DD-metalloendopeptidase family protein [Calditrichota bacterium]